MVKAIDYLIKFCGPTITNVASQEAINLEDLKKSISVCLYIVFLDGLLLLYIQICCSVKTTLSLFWMRFAPWVRRLRWKGKWTVSPWLRKHPAASHCHWFGRSNQRISTNFWYMMRTMSITIFYTIWKCYVYFIILRSL